MEILYLIHKASHHWCLYYVKPLLVENEWWPENWRTEKGNVGVRRVRGHVMRQITTVELDIPH